MAELEKWAEALPSRNVLREFLEWLDGEKLEVAQWTNGGRRMMPITEDRERLLSRYFGINESNLERERMELLRSATADRQGQKP